MKPDHELREFIATMLMGWVRSERFSDVWTQNGSSYMRLPEYELEYAPALQAAGAMVCKGYRFQFNMNNEDPALAAFMRAGQDFSDAPWGEHEHLPTAIALAIVAALESEKP